MKKLKNFKLLYSYLKDDKLKIIIYLILILSTYLPLLTAAYLWGMAVEELLKKNLMNFILYFSIWNGIYVMCYSVLQIPRDKLYNYFEIKFIREVSHDLYKKIDNLPCIAFEDIGVGEYINRLYNDTDRIMSLLNNLIRLLCKSISAIVLLVITFSISIVLGLEIILFCLGMGIISYKFFPKIRKTQEEIKKQTDQYVKEATENITGIREIKALGIKKQTEKKIFNQLSDLFKKEKKIRNYEVWYYSLNNFLYFALQFLIFYTAGRMFIAGNIEYAIFAMLDAYVWRLDEVVESLSDFGVNYNKVAVSLKRIDEIVNNRLYNDEKYGTKNLTKSKGIIKFNNVSFRYRNEEKDALTNLNLEIVPNKKIAIVGRSGNGKSTIFNLLLRYFDINSGTITLDDIDIKNLTESSLRKNISIIRQNPFLFNMSIMDNFRLVKENVTKEEVIKVCKKAYINDYISSLKDGYNTIIGEGGVNLSGGQKQRLAIARTLLLNTKVILFDEATSALDNESQDYIKRTMDDLVKDHTIIIVAHRLSTIVDADIIHVINKGSLVASGTHKDLLKTSDVYKKLYEMEDES